MSADGCAVVDGADSVLGRPCCVWRLRTPVSADGRAVVDGADSVTVDVVRRGSSAVSGRRMTSASEPCG